MPPSSAPTVLYAILRLAPYNNQQVSERETTDIEDQAAAAPAAGRVLALDLGTKRVGVAVSDEMHLTARPLDPLQRSNWKKLVRDIAGLCRQFDVETVVIGLPLTLDGTLGDAAREAQRIARNLSLSLTLPVGLQDERLTSREAEERLRQCGFNAAEIRERVDSEAARLILLDYLARSDQPRANRGDLISR